MPIQSVEPGEAKPSQPPGSTCQRSTTRAVSDPGCWRRCLRVRVCGTVGIMLLCYALAREACASYYCE